MKKRTLTVLLSVLVLSCLIWTYHSTSAQTKNPGITLAAKKTPKLSPRVRSVIRGSEKPAEIPDEVAYELFLRTVGEYNAPAIMQKSGLSDEQIQSVTGEAVLLNDTLSKLDHYINEAKKGDETLELNKRSIDEKVGDYSAQKKRNFDRALKLFLPQVLATDGMKKLDKFVQTSVKKNIQKIFLSNTVQDQRPSILKPFINSFSPQTSVDENKIYFYTAAWHDGDSVYGAGNVYEQTPSSNSYKISVAVTSPYSRTASTNSDWGHAPFTQDAGLSIDIEDGEYAVTATFESGEGNYDEYGNFTGISSMLGEETDTELVPPQVSMGPISPSEAAVLRPGEIKTFNLSIKSTLDVPVGTRVTVQVNETSNVPYVDYSVLEPANRIKIFNVQSPGSATTVPFKVRVSDNSDVGNFGNEGRISDVVNPVAVPSPAVTIVGDGRSAEMKVSVTLPPQSSGCTNTGAQYACLFKGFDWDFESCRCSGSCIAGGSCSPIAIDVSGNGFTMTSAEDGVYFDLDGIGYKPLLSWIAPNSDDAWLAFDRNNNRRIDNGTELFGNASEQPEGQNPKQGFASLGMFDTMARGGNGDGKITRKDLVFRKLRLWQDRNHNGISEAEELHRLGALDVVAIRLDYAESNRVDQYGNRFKYRAKVRDKQNASVGRWAWDVFLVPAEGH